MKQYKGLNHVRLSEVYDGTVTYPDSSRRDKTLPDDKEPDPLKTKKIKLATDVSLDEILQKQNNLNMKEMRQRKFHQHCKQEFTNRHKMTF